MKPADGALRLDRFTPFDDLPELLRVEEFAAVAGFSKGVVYDLVRRGELPSIKFGRKIVRVPKTALTRQTT